MVYSGSFTTDNQGKTKMAQGNNTVKCPKCEKEETYLVTVKNGRQYVVCKHCGTMLTVEVKNGQFTGKVEG
jgi:transcription elongation factor Elf1